MSRDMLKIVRKYKIATKRKKKKSRKVFAKKVKTERDNNGMT
jgi:hypothetical protein